jgi:hypothetical protein
MVYDEEILIDDEMRTALNAHFLSIDGVTSGNQFGGVSYLLNGQPFAILMEGVVALRLPPANMEHALTLAGVSPFRPPSLDDPIKGWLQFVLLLPEDVYVLYAWFDAAMEQVK